MSHLPETTRMGGDALPSCGTTGAAWLPPVISPSGRSPRRLTVNGVPVATLIASPHDLHFLVSGFLGCRGWVRPPGTPDLERVRRLRRCVRTDPGRVPDRITPTFTSGAGRDQLPPLAVRGASGHAPSAGSVRFPESLFFGDGGARKRCVRGVPAGGREPLGRRVGRRGAPPVRRGYRAAQHGSTGSRAGTLSGIDSPAEPRRLGAAFLGDGAEGRLPRDLRDRSRTSPTDARGPDMRGAGITLVGYVRAEVQRLHHPARIAAQAARGSRRHGGDPRGGRSTRMGATPGGFFRTRGGVIEAITAMEICSKR